MSLENGLSRRNRLLDPITLEELPQDSTCWIHLDGAAYSPVSVRILVESWEKEKMVHPEARVAVASYRMWTRGYAGVWGAYTLPNPLRQGIAFSNDALKTIHGVLSSNSVRCLRG